MRPQFGSQFLSFLLLTAVSLERLQLLFPKPSPSSPAAKEVESFFDCLSRLQQTVGSEELSLFIE